MSINKIFQEIGKIQTDRSAFDLSHKNITTMNMGIAYPVLNLFAMPGDKFKINVTSLMKAMPFVNPPYIDVMINFVFFFVPSRLLWDEFEDFISGGEKGDFSKPMPKLNLQGGEDVAFSDSVITRLGLLPTIFDATTDECKKIYAKIPIELCPTSLPLRAYYMIYNEWFRNQNTQDKVDISNLNDWLGSQIKGSYNGMFRVNWMKDYFSSALPFQQRGVAPAIPFEATIDTSKLSAGSEIGDVAMLGDYDNRILLANSKKYMDSFPGFGVAGSTLVGEAVQSSYYKTYTNDKTNDFLKNLKVNINDTFNISELRTAFQVQKFLERNARAGVRYTEFLKAHFNVSPTDERLDRPELIGGSKFPLIISDIIQSSETSTESPLGTRGGVGTSAGYTDDFPVDYFVQEFGYIIGISFIRPVADYFQGINRQYQYTDRFEMPMPEFMHLSEQGITESELFIASATTTLSSPGEIFGYQGMYDELRVCNNRISGLMGRKDYLPWHLARKFTNAPKLNAEFSICNPDTRIFAIEDSNLTAQFMGEIDFSITAIRPMPIIAEPGLIDHF